MRRFSILAEGPDDVHAIFHLLRRHNIPICEPNIFEDSKITLESRNGVERLLESLEVQLKGIDNDRAEDIIGIIIDADADSVDSQLENDALAGLTRRWQRVRDILLGSGYSDVPDQPEITGTIIATQDKILPKIGIWLMPDNQLPGQLEHFAKLLIPQNDALFARAEGCILAIPQADRKFTNLIKAQIHTWLAWQEEPGKPIGQAITKGYLTYDATVAQQFILWIHRLFEI